MSMNNVYSIQEILDEILAEIGEAYLEKDRTRELRRQRDRMKALHKIETASFKNAHKDEEKAKRVTVTYRDSKAIDALNAGSESL